MLMVEHHEGFLSVTLRVVWQFTIMRITMMASLLLGKIMYMNRLIIFPLITYKETQKIVDVQMHFIANDHELNSLPYCPNTTFQKCGTIPLAILKIYK